MPDEQRCEVCNWPLATSAKEGCVPGNCAQRPVPTCHICGKPKGQPPERCNGHYGERYDEQLPPLSDDRIRELQDLTRNGPDVVAMAQEIERLRQREERMREALAQIEIRAESSYDKLRKWLDSGPDCRNWVRGDDGPAHPLLRLAEIARAALANEHGAQLLPDLKFLVYPGLEKIGLGLGLGAKRIVAVCSSQKQAETLINAMWPGIGYWEVRP